MVRKPFEVPDYELWETVMRSIHPLPLRKLPKPAKAAPHRHEAVLRASPVHQPAPPKKARTQPPPIVPLERRLAQKLGRGQMEPDSRIDLHGETLETARFQLLHFVAQRRQLGEKIILVITGKGASPWARHTLHGLTHFHAPEREGRLRREVPLWLHESQFRVHVVGFQPAHPRHGGGGAFYVRLRKKGSDLL